MNRIEYLENLEQLFSNTIAVMAKRKDFGERFVQVVKLRYKTFVEVEELRKAGDQITDKKTYLERLKNHMEVAFLLTMTQQDNSEVLGAILRIHTNIDEEITKYYLSGEEDDLVKSKNNNH